MMKNLMMLTAVALMMQTAPVLADNHGEGEKGKRFEKHDTNGDGVISKDEFLTSFSSVPKYSLHFSIHAMISHCSFIASLYVSLFDSSKISSQFSHHHIRHICTFIFSASVKSSRVFGHDFSDH